MDRTKLRIVMQYRERGGMTYELERDGMQLCLRVAETDAQWRIEARMGRSRDAECIAGAASTRTEALAEVGRLWRASQLSRGLPPFDWDAVAAALTLVRAL